MQPHRHGIFPRIAIVAALLLARVLTTFAADPSLMELDERVKGAIDRADFHAFEKMVIEWQPVDGKLPMCRDGQSRLMAVHSSLQHYPHRLARAYQRFQTLLDAWQKAAPDSAHWRIYQAFHLAGDISAEGKAADARTKWNRAVQLLDEAEASLGRAPDWYCSYLALALAGRKLTGKGFLDALPGKFKNWIAVADEGIRRFPDHVEIWFHSDPLVTFTNFPKGRDGWARHLCEIIPERGFETYSRVWWSHEFRYTKSLFHEGNADWPTFRTGFFGLLKRYPESKRLVAKFLEFCRKSGDRETAQKLLPLIGEHPGTDAFPVTVRFLEIRQWAIGEAKTRTPIWNRNHGTGYSVAWSKDGSLVYAGFDSRVVHVLDAKTGENVQLLPMEDNMHRDIRDIAVSPDGKLVAAVNGGESTKIPGTCKIWQTDTFEEKGTFKSKAGPLRSVSWAADSARLIASGGLFEGPGEAWLWADGANADGINLDVAKSHSIEAAAWAPDNSKLLFNSSSGRVIVVEPQKKLREVKQATVKDATWITSIRFSPDGKWVAASCSLGRIDQFKANGSVAIFSAEDMEPRKDAHAPLTEGLLTVDWSPDGKRIACGGFDGYVYVLDAATLEIAQWWNPEQGQIQKVRWSPDGTKIATATATGGVSVWKAE